MENYFENLVSNLTIEDMVILGFLYDNDSDSAYKSIKRSIVKQETELSVSTFKKALLRLEAIKFIDIDKHSKEHKIFITDYGQTALSKQIEREEV